MIQAALGCFYLHHLPFDMYKCIIRCMNIIVVFTIYILVFFIPHLNMSFLGP